MFCDTLGSRTADLGAGVIHSLRRKNLKMAHSVGLHETGTTWIGM